MGLTIEPLLDVVADCDDATGWSIGDVDTDLFVQGQACLSEQVKATTGAVFLYTIGSTIDLSAGKHVFAWMFVAGAVDTKSNGGYRIFLQSSSGNDATFYVGGSDTVIGGWYCFVLDPTSTPDASNGTLDLSAVSAIGVQFKTVTSIAGTGNNCFWDIIRYGTGYNVTSLDTDTITLADILAVDDAVANKYGVLSLSNGVYFAKGNITYGNTTGSDIVATINDSLLVFTQDTVSADLFKLATAGDTAVTATLQIDGSVIKSAGVKSTLDLSDIDTTVSSAGTAFVNTGAITLNANHTVSPSSFKGCDEIIPNGASLSSVSISYTTEATTGSLNLSTLESISACSDITFINYNGKYAVYIPASVTGAITFDGFIGDGSGTDVYWAGTSGTLTVSKSGGTNFTTSATGGGTVEFVGASATIDITVKDEVDNSLVVDSAVTIIVSDGTGPFPYQESVTITSSAGVATVAHTAHGFSTGHKTGIKGANENEYNRIKTITVIDANSYTFPVDGTPASPATGTITSTAVLVDGVTNSSGYIEDVRVYDSNQNYSGVIQKGTGAIIYKARPVSGQVNAITGSSLTVLLTRD